jgi:hypothetical protein
MQLNPAVSLSSHNEVGEQTVLLNHNSPNTDHVFNDEVLKATQRQQPSQSNFHSKLINRQLCELTQFQLTTKLYRQKLY